MNPREAGGGHYYSDMDRRLKHSSRRFAAAMSSIVEKYNFPFDEDMVVSIRSLTYDTPDGPKVWGQETSTDIDESYQSIVKCQENTVLQQQSSDSENGEYTYDQSFEEEPFMNSYGVCQLDTGQNSSAEMASIKRHLENIHIKENIPLVCYSQTPVKNKYRVQMDMLLDDDASSVPQALTVTRMKAKNVHQWSWQELEDKSIIVDRHDVVLTKQAQSANGHSASISIQLSNSAAPHSANGTIVPRNQPLWSNNETGYSSFLEMYESADEHCSWSNVTIADLYPGMVKALSILLHKESRKASSSSLMKRYRYGYLHSKKTKLNISTERIRKSRPLKLKSSLTVTEGDGQRHKLPIANDGSNHSFDDNKHQMKCSVNNVSSICCNADLMDIDSSGIVEVYSYTKKVGQNGTDTTVYPSDLPADKTFLVRSPSYIPSSSDCVRKGKTFEEYSPTICPVDSGATFNLVAEGKTQEMSNGTFKFTSCLSSSLSSSASSYLQNSKSSPVKSSNRLLGNNEIKMFSRAISLQRSHSFSSFPVNRSPIKVQQKCEDAFENIYKELCSPKLQKPFKFSNICTSPRKSVELHKSGFNCLSSKVEQTPNDTFENIYQKLCPEGFPKIPTSLRAANLKKYEGIQMSETVNALVNSPIRTLPAVARIKRTANFCNEDFESSPIKRFKNISENSSYRICRELPYWKNMNVQKSDMTFTMYSPNTNNLTSNVDSGSCVSSNHRILAVPCTVMKESRIADVDENIHKCLLNCDFLKKSQNCTVGVSRKLSYNDRRVRNTNAYVEEFIRKDYNGSFLEGYEEEIYDF